MLAKNIIQNEPLTMVDGQPKTVRLVYEHSFMNLAIPDFVDQIKTGISPDVQDFKDAKQLNDYLMARFAVIDNKIAFSSEIYRKQVLSHIPQHQHDFMSTKLLFRHIEFIDVTADKLRESAVKVADSLGADRRYHIIFVPAGNVNITKLSQQACSYLEIKTENYLKVLKFAISTPKESLEFLRKCDPLAETVDAVLNEIKK